MNCAVEQMLSRYQISSTEESLQALREILQEIALVGLWRGHFFDHAAFYGETALRIFYGLDRFSEDLDFTLYHKNSLWNWEPYKQIIENELSSYGFDVAFQEKEKKQQSSVKSAFLKTTTFEQLLKIGYAFQKHPETLIKIKIELDIDPPIFFKSEQKFLTAPLPIAVRCVDEISLFACKMNAAFYRTWKKRVKGRDWYDMVWFIRRKIPFDLQLFNELTKQELSKNEFLELFHERIEELDVNAAIEDIIYFVKDVESIKRNWSKEFFHYWKNQIIFF